MQLVWFRQDLRIHDNSALTHAMQQGPAMALYVVSPAQWQQHADAPLKVDFQLRNLLQLAAGLQQLNVPLLVLRCELWRDLPEKLLEFCQRWQVRQLHFNDQYGVNEQQRDQACSAILHAAGIGVQRHQDGVLFAPGSVRNRHGQMFQVFTPFKKACWQRLHHSPPRTLRTPAAQAPVAIASQLQEAQQLLAHNPQWNSLWPAGEQYAWQQLNSFCQHHLAHYQQERDFPALDGTSRLSPYLACGVLSVGSCWQAAVHTNQGEFDSGCQGTVTWLNELLWREFYQHLLALHPRLSRGAPYQAHTQHINWREAPQDLQAWQQGRTGFPLIDAAMRQLAATGWMHNRLRMVVAMFFSKNLLLDWRLGEHWFMQHLIDGDLAANNGGWQWSASTGTDAAPYFRVFNPLTQSRRFDPHGRFIRQWLPELAHLSDQEIHLPPQDLFTRNYPPPIVDLKASRVRAIEAFRQIPASLPAGLE